MTLVQVISKNFTIGTDPQIFAGFIKQPGLGLNKSVLACSLVSGVIIPSLMWCIITLEAWVKSKSLLTKL
jgi:hypothetical protein